MVDQSYWVWLQSGLGYGSATADVVLERGFSPEDLYKMTQSELEALEAFTPNQIMNMKMSSLNEAKTICEDCSGKYYNLVTPDMEAYPERLVNISAAPLVLYVEGKQEALMGLDDIPTLGIVGTRKMSTYGCRVATNLSFDLAGAGFTIVSGLAMGIDTQAHAGALRAGGKTIAVLGCGLDINYPVQNTNLRKEIVQTGAVVTEYPPSLPPTKRNFPTRNRLIAGLSLGILVIEANRSSGSLITAGHALAQGKEIYAVPTDIYDPNGEGVIKLIQDGAKPVSKAWDIAADYFWRYGEKISTEKMTNTTVVESMVKPIKLEPERGSRPRWVNLSQEKASPKVEAPAEITALSGEQKQVYTFLTAEPQSIEILMRLSGLEMNKILSIMTEIELCGLAKAYPGQRYSC